MEATEGTTSDSLFFVSIYWSSPFPLFSPDSDNTLLKQNFKKCIKILNYLDVFSFIAVLKIVNEAPAPTEIGQHPNCLTFSPAFVS